MKDNSDICETCVFSSGKKCDIAGYDGPFRDFTAYDYNAGGICRYYRKSKLPKFAKRIFGFIADMLRH